MKSTRTQSFDSASLPGASFVLKSIGRSLRNQIELELVEQRHQQRLIAQEQLSILPDITSGDDKKVEAAHGRLPQEDKERLDRIQIRGALLHEQVKLEYAKTLLVSFSLPGADYEEITNPADLFEFGPEEFVAEIANRSEELWSLTAAERKNSQSPSTSDTPVDGKTTDSTATVVDSNGSTSSEIAA